MKTTTKEWLLSLLASIAVLAFVVMMAGGSTTYGEPSSKSVGALASSAKDGGMEE